MSGLSDEENYRARRIQWLRQGVTQWGHDGKHHGNGTPECPRELHHHHDDRCELPTLGECVAAGIEPRKPHEWGSRA